MSRRIKFINAAASAVLMCIGVCAIASAADLKCKPALTPEQELLVLHQIDNLMGRYFHVSLLEGEDKLEPLFAMQTEGVSWRDPVGPSTIKGMKERFAQSTSDQVRAAQLNLNTMLTPVVEVAKDGKTAQGVWDSVGTNVRNLDDVGVWLWAKYGVDFIKENGEWKIWHLQIYPIFLTPYDKSITQSAKERAARGDKIPDPKPGWSGPKGGMWLYDGKTLPRGPKIPMPYCTFEASNSN